MRERVTMDDVRILTDELLIVNRIDRINGSWRLD
jgi:hypothetical protein